ncbi:hypothetical protein [Paraburkholderia bannensis]|uniref:hypothetical protein n=1 Tax=Paraburkholderia bannensis TaxID=765414 RepID=UPI002AB65BFA|nr:hypothetical protein [Paraburkholderia bannensis]
MSDRELHIHMARVHLMHARVSRHHPAWHATLLRWAAERRNRATKKTEEPAQLDLFA